MTQAPIRVYTHDVTVGDVSAFADTHVGLSYDRSVQSRRALLFGYLVRYFELELELQLDVKASNNIPR